MNVTKDQIFSYESRRNGETGEPQTTQQKDQGYFRMFKWMTVELVQVNIIFKCLQSAKAEEPKDAGNDNTA